MSTETLVTDPVCGMEIHAGAAVVVAHDGETCERVCADIFQDDPDWWRDGFAGCKTPQRVRETTHTARGAASIS